MVTDGMLTVSGLLQLRLGRPAINQPSTCTKFFVSEWQRASVVLSVLLQFCIPAGQSTFLSLLFIFHSAPKCARKEYEGVERRETHLPVISKWLFLPSIQYTRVCSSFILHLMVGLSFLFFLSFFFLGCLEFVLHGLLDCVSRSFIVGTNRAYLSKRVCIKCGRACVMQCVALEAFCSPYLVASHQLCRIHLIPILQTEMQKN